MAGLRSVRPAWLWSAGCALLLASLLVSLSLGVYEVSIRALLDGLLRWLARSPPGDEAEAGVDLVLREFRAPRVLLALLVGMALAAAGVALQAVFRNPLADPFILGISSGAALGAALSMAFLTFLPVQVSAFVCGLAAMLVALYLARVGQQTPIVSLILAGVVVSAFCTAGLSIVQFMVDPDRLGSIVFWLMGSFSLASWRSVAVTAPLLLAGLAALLFLGWRLNLLSLGDEEAASLGIPVRRYKLAVIVVASLLAAGAVSVCGIIGWVGLIVPHMARMLVGPEHRRLLPFAVALGAAFMLWADNLARSLASFEIPVGILTTLLGAPVFMILLKRAGRSWIG